MTMPGPATATHRQLVDGVWSVPECDLGETLDDPNTGLPGSPQRETGAASVDAAIEAAVMLHSAGDWRCTPVDTRAGFLCHAAELLQARVEEIAVADALNSGVVVSVTRAFASGVCDTLRDAARHLQQDPGTASAEANSAARLHHLPWGPAAVLAPWNAPTFVLAKKSAFALAAGAPVIAKPSNWAPTGATIFAEELHRAAIDMGLSAVAFQLVHGSAAVGQQLAGDPRIRALSFTGGRPGGTAVARTAAADCKALQLELGSNNPAIVRADCDVDATADALVSGFTKLNGQWCESPGSVAVVASCHDALVDALLDRMHGERLGHCLDDTATMGPQAHRLQHRQVSAAVDRLNSAGGVVHQVSAVPETSGWFFPPTVVVGAPAALTVDEIFGPVLTVHRVADDAEALELANSRRTGLAGYVFGTDLDAALALGAELDCGEVKINGTSVLDLCPESTQGFWGGSGIGAHGDAELLRFFRGARIVGVEPAGRPI